MALKPGDMGPEFTLPSIQEIVASDIPVARDIRALLAKARAA